MSSVAPLMTLTQHTEALVVSTLIQLVIMISAARIMNLVFRRLGQPGVIGETVAGLLPSKIFTMLVIMALVTTLMAGPFLKILMPRLGLIIPRNIET
jgi:Kef-type K+ transport system membrane component KefB